jgi:hypothetical protein
MVSDKIEEKKAVDPSQLILPESNSPARKVWR